MRHYILALMLFALPLQAYTVKKNTMGDIGSGLGRGLAQGFEQSMKIERERQVREQMMYERERQIIREEILKEMAREWVRG